MRLNHLVYIVALFTALECAVAAPGNGTSLPDDIALSDNGFRPNLHGFSFENYGSNIDSVDLTSDEMQRMFGDKVCASTSGGKCVLTHPAERWMQEAIQAMEWGHCEGMAVLSDLIYCGQMHPGEFGANLTINLTIRDEPLQREIGYWWATQITRPGGSNKVHESPDAVLDVLSKAFKEGRNASEWWVMGIYMPDGSGGHAMTPFAVEDLEGGKSRILVYDNNWPNDIRYVEVDRNTNTWRYQASINPDEPSTMYAGNASTHSLEIASITARLVRQECDFCDDSGDSVVTEDSPSGKHLQIWQDGEANAIVTDKNGRKTGLLASGDPINEIPGAEIRYLKLGRRYPPIIFVPLESSNLSDIRVNVTSAKKDNKKNRAETTIMGPGIAVVFSNPDLGYGQEQSISLIPGAEGYAVSFDTNQKISPAITIESDLKQVKISGANIEPGGNIEIEVDRIKDEFSISTRGNALPGMVQVKVSSIDQVSGEVTALNSSGTSLKPNDVISIGFAGSTGGASMPFINVDHEDGARDQVIMMAARYTDQFSGSDVGAGRAGIDAPGSSNLNLSNPGMIIPGVNNPGITNPGMTTPDISNPGLNNPGLATPDISSPEITTPEAINPGITTPGMSSPGISTPDISSPGIGTPEAINPGITTPGMSSPGITTPDIVRK